LSKRVLQVGAGIALAAALALAGYWLLFSVFMVYDDEGYVLISLKNFAAGGALYDQVYSQYGPFFFLVGDALHRLTGLAWTNTLARWITLLNWWGTATICAWLVWRFTRSLALTLFTGAVVFAYLWIMVNEPMHPGGWLGLVVALLAWGGAETLASSRWQLFAAAAGATGAAAALIKINVGGCLWLAAAAWLLLHTPAAARWGRWILALLFACLPFALMHPLLAAPWVRLLALTFVVAMLGVLLVARPVAPVARGRVWLVFLGASALATAMICGLTLTRGTSLAGLFTGIILDPLKHPGVFSFSFAWRVGAAPSLLVGLAVCLLSVRWGEDERFCRGVAWIRLGLLAAALLSPLKLIPTGLAAFGMSYGVGAAGLLALPLRRTATAPVRLWLALMLGLQLLHAFPIAGSQINWGTFLWIPLLALGVEEAVVVLAEQPRRQFRWLRWAANGVLLAVAIVVAGRLVRAGWGNHQNGEPLRLPGAEDIILPDDTSFALRIMTENACAHGDLLFSLPGVFSFNLWSGLPTPTLANATHWFSLLSPRQQDAILARLDQSPQACLIVQMDTLNYLVDHGFSPRGKLADYVFQTFQPAFEVDHYAFWVRRGRSVAPLSTGTLRPNAGAPVKQRLELVLATAGDRVAMIELWEMGRPARSHRLTLSAANATLDVTPVAPTGDPLGAPQALAWSTPLPSRMIRLSATFHGEVGAAERLLAFVIDPQGRRIAAARVLR